MLFLSRKEIESCFSMRDAIDSVEKSFSESFQGNIVSPLRTVMQAPDGVFLSMSAYMEKLGYAILKVVDIFPKNPECGLPAAPSAVILFDGKTGIPLAYMDGTYITQLRTGGATGAAFRRLAREDARIGAMIGAGGQAEMQIEAMLTVRHHMEEVRIADVSWERAEVLAAKMQKKYPNVRFVASADSSDAVREADLIVTATSSKKPTFPAGCVKKGVTVSAVGAFRPDMQEIDPIFVSTADKIFCDSKEAVLAESGDIIIPMQNGDIAADFFIEDLAQVLLGYMVGRESDEQNILFETVGFAAEDLLTAAAIYERAVTGGYGFHWGEHE